MRFTIAILVLLLSAVHGVSQAPPTSNPYMLEVTYFPGMPHSFQPISGWSWYALFQRVDGWQPRPEEAPVKAVKIYPKWSNGSATVRVTVLRGLHMEIEDPVGTFAVTTEKVTIVGLQRFGIVPFELALARNVTRAAALPEVENQTTSFLIRVDTSDTNPNNFRVEILNNSAKEVTAFSWQTVAGAHVFSMALRRRRDGAKFIAPGESYAMSVPYNYQLKRPSNGETPPFQEGLRFRVSMVLFADGTYEGNARDAMQVKAFEAGDKIQLRRILQALRSSDGNISTARELLDTLKYKVKREDVKAYIDSIPALTDEEKEQFRNGAEISAMDLLQSARSILGQPNLSNTALRDLIDRYEKSYELLP